MTMLIVTSRGQHPAVAHLKQTKDKRHGVIPWNIDIRWLEVFCVWSTGECSRWSQPSWLSDAL